MQKVIIISAPSGAGKTSIVKCLLKKDARLSFSVSATSRKKRENEIDGRDYHFISPEEFKNKIDAGEFIEWEMVYDGVFYGSLKNEIEKIWNENKVVIFDVDVKGGINLKNYFENKALSFFIKVGDIKTLEQRLRLRSTESEGTLKTRLNKAMFEMTFENEFDEIIINDNLELSCEKVFHRIAEFLIN